MGLIKAIKGAAGSAMADQWKEFFYCESMSNDVLVVKGVKRTGPHSSNTKGSDNIISNGSGIAVADGQCMIIVEQGKIVEVCAEPGEFTFDNSTEPSVFAGGLDGIINTFKVIGKRFTYGGDTGKDQRIYYFNTKELIDNKFGTPNPIPFRVVDRNIGLDIDVSVRCNGVYSYRIADPLLFYTNVCGNVEREYTKDEIAGQLKTEFVSALQPAFAKISEMEIRPSALPAHAEEIAEAMNEALSKKWSEIRGLEVVTVALNPITLPEEDQELIKNAQKTAILRDPNMAAATLAGAQAEAMKSAASNDAGAMTGFMGMGMAMNAGGGINANDLFAMGRQQQTGSAPSPAVSSPSSGASPAASGDAWTCKCGKVNTGKFCQECGASKPEDDKWTCTCGTVNSGKFCSECGAKKPDGKWTCTCGEVNEGKFCPQCGAKRPE